MKEKLANIIRNNDEYSLNVFIDRYMNGDTEKFLDIVSKTGLFNDSEIFENLIDMFPMTYLHTRYRSNPDETAKYIVDNYFGDLEATEDGRYFLTLNDRESLSNFFKNDGGRNDMGSRELAKLMFQEDWFEPFYDTYTNIYEDVVQELNSENLYLLANAINDELLNTEISPETSLLEDIAHDQGHPDFVILSTDLILNEIFNDEETTKHLLLHEAVNVGSELSSLHNNAANTAYVDEKWEQASDEIKSFFSIDNIGEWSTKKVTNYKGEEVDRHTYKIEVTNMVPELIQSVFDDKYHNDDSQNIFEYYGDFENLLTFLIDEDTIEGASISIPYYDYPDHDRTVKYLNELFKDYI